MTKIDTTWEVWIYDVWGNKVDGYEVNDRYCIHRRYPLRLEVQIANAGTKEEFGYAYPTDAQIRRSLGVSRVRIDTDGDDTFIIVSEANNGYPIGEMHCTSHKSLSPIREK